MRPETVKRATAAVLKRARRAARGPVAFLEFAGREEHTRERVSVPPHLRVLLAFVAAHPRSVVRAFVGSGKTWTLAHLGLWLSGRDPTGRGAFVGASAEGAEPTLGLIRDMVDNPEDFPEVPLVFPELRPSPRVSDPWGQRAVTFDRPAGIRDPSWSAVGYKGRLPGRRLKWIVGDDMLDEDNTSTPAARDKFGATFARRVLTRLDARDAFMTFVNTPWDPDDMSFRLEATGEWAVLSMEVEGEVRVTNTEWTSPLLRPSRLAPRSWRLAAHDAAPYAPLCEVLPDGSRRAVDPARGPTPGLPTEHYDVDETVPLWPEKFGVAEIDQIRRNFAADPGGFQAKYKLRPRVPADEAKKRAWVEACKANARALGPDYWHQAAEYRGPNLTVTGLDLATGLDDGSDWRAIFTFEVVPELTFHVVGPDGAPVLRQLRNARRILRVRYGRWAGAELIEVVRRDVAAFDSRLRVETNAGQDFFRQWLAQRDAALPIAAHVTGEKNKHARVSGIPGVYIVLENLAWIIPCDADGRCEPDVQRWVDGLLAWRPELHPDDGLLASWLAHEEARAVLGDAFLGVDLASVEQRFRH